MWNSKCGSFAQLYAEHRIAAIADQFAELMLTSGTVNNGSGVIVADIKLEGNYTNATFTIVEDTSNNTVAVSDPLSMMGGTPTTVAPTGGDGHHHHHHQHGASNAALLGNYMAAFSSPAIGQLGAQTLETPQTESLLTHPQTG